MLGRCQSEESEERMNETEERKSIKRQEFTEPEDENGIFIFENRSGLESKRPEECYTVEKCVRITH